MSPWGAAARAWLALGAIVGGYALAMFLAGLDPAFSRPLAPLVVAAASIGVACVCRGTVARAALLGAVAALACAWWMIRIGALPDDDSGRASDLTGAIVTIEGVVTERPRPAMTHAAFGPGAAWSFPVRIDRIENAPFAWRAGDVVRVRCEGRADASVGHRTRLTGTFDTLQGPQNPGERDHRPRALQDGVIGRLRTSGAMVDDLGPASGPRAAIDRAREALRARADRALGAEAPRRGESPGVALARSLILGEDDGAPLEAARDSFTRVGLSHVLAISGFHLVVLVWSAVMLLRLLGDRGPLEPIAVGSMVLVYALIVPAEAPVIRAAIMAMAFLLADALGRRHDRLAVLAWVACALLIWRPADAASLGFQLSIGLTGVLLWIGTRMNDRLWGPVLRGTVTTPDPTVRSILGRAAKSLVSASILCWLVGLPVIAWHTGSISVLAVPATLVVVPVCVVLMWLGFVALVGGMIWPPVGAALLPVLDRVGTWIADLVLWFDESGASLIRVGPFSALLASSAVALALWWCLSGRWRSAPHWLATALVACWGAFELRAFGGMAPDVRLRIDTLAVGDGTCHILRANGQAMLWDCGSLARSDVGARTLPRAARALGITRIPVAVLTHPNADHWNGLVDAARTMGMRVLLVGDATLDEVLASPDTRLGLALRELSRRGVEIRRVGAGDSLPLGHARVEFVWPPDGFESGEANERSLVARVVPRTPASTDDNARSDALLTGDIQAIAISAMIEAHPDLTTRVLELPHHGSMIRATVDLLAHADPAAVHQSTGRRRAEDDRMERWRSDFDGRWGVTARDGWVWTEVTRDGAVRGGSMRNAAPD